MRQHVVPVIVRVHVRGMLRERGYRCSWRDKRVLRVWCPCGRDEILLLTLAVSDISAKRYVDAYVIETVHRVEREMAEHERRIQHG